MKKIRIYKKAEVLDGVGNFCLCGKIREVTLFRKMLGKECSVNALEECFLSEIINLHGFVACNIIILISTGRVAYLLYHIH